MSDVRLRRTTGDGECRVSVVVSASPRFAVVICPGAIRLEPFGHEDVADVDAVEAACLSGAFYAQRNVRLDGFKVDIVHVSGWCKGGHVEGFAKAVACAVAQALHRDDRFALDTSREWEVLLCEDRRETPS
jgi:hypothetical protein